MLVKQKQITKKDVTYVCQNDSIEDVLTTLNDSGFRCIPVLDAEGQKYVGNIYKVNVLEYLIADGDMTLPIATLTIESEAFIHETGSFFEIFDSIKQLPYLAVVDTQGTFSGILPHSKVFELIEQAWGYKSGSAALLVAVPDASGILVKVLQAVQKRWTLHCVFSLDDEITTYFRRVIITIKKGASQQTINEIEAAISKIGARLIDIEVFDKENF